MTSLLHSLTGGDVEPGDDVLWDVVKVLHQCSERVAVSGDLSDGMGLIGRRERGREAKGCQYQACSTFKIMKLPRFPATNQL